MGTFNPLGGKFSKQLSDAEVKEKLAEAMDAANVNWSAEQFTFNRPGIISDLHRPYKMVDIFGRDSIGDQYYNVRQRFSSVVGCANLYGPTELFNNVDYAIDEQITGRIDMMVGFSVNGLESKKATASGIDAKSTKMMGAQEALSYEENNIGWHGAQGLSGNLFGVTNHSSLIAAGTVPNGAGGSPLWSNKTGLEIEADVESMINEVAGNIDDFDVVVETPSTLILPTSKYQTLKQVRINNPSLTEVTVFESLGKKYPKMKIRSAQDLQAVSGGQDMAIFMLDNVSMIDRVSTDDKSVIKHVSNGVKVVDSDFKVGHEEFSTKMKLTSFGVLVYRPYAVSRRIGM